MQEYLTNAVHSLNAELDRKGLPRLRASQISALKNEDEAFNIIDELEYQRGIYVADARQYLTFYHDPMEG